MLFVALSFWAEFLQICFSLVLASQVIHLQVLNSTCIVFLGCRCHGLDHIISDSLKNRRWARWVPLQSFLLYSQTHLHGNGFFIQFSTCLTNPTQELFLLAFCFIIIASSSWALQQKPCQQVSFCIQVMSIPSYGCPFVRMNDGLGEWLNLIIMALRYLEGGVYTRVPDQRNSGAKFWTLGVYTKVRAQGMKNEVLMWHHIPTKSCWSQHKKIFTIWGCNLESESEVH